jgi:hypothetical protein
VFSGYRDLGLKWSVLEDNHTPIFRAEVKNEWSYTSTAADFFMACKEITYVNTSQLNCTRKREITVTANFRITICGDVRWMTAPKLLLALI